MARFSRATAYRKAVEWIALNDEPTEANPAEVENQISVLLVADLFDKECSEVAKDVIHDRACAERRKAW